jgi:hypothetical protein
MPATKIRPLDPARFGQAGHKRNEFVIFLPVDQPYEDLFQIDFWKSIARGDKVRPGDKIEVIRDDISLVAQLVVRESIGKHARIVVGEVSKTIFPRIVQDAGDDEQYEIKHLGMQDQWAVLLRSTQRVLAKDMKSRDEAKSYINSLRPQPIGR